MEKQNCAYKHSLYLIALLLTISIISGCTGYMARKSPEELAVTPDGDLCDQYFNVIGNSAASSMDMGRRELEVVYEEFIRRGIPAEKVSYHCSKLTE